MRSGGRRQFLDEAQGATRSFTVASTVDAILLMTPTAIGLIFALKGMFPQHRQWMTRSYAVSLTFLQIRFILGQLSTSRQCSEHRQEREPSFPYNQ
jgi:hypothetical protein